MPKQINAKNFRRFGWVISAGGPRQRPSRRPKSSRTAKGKSLFRIVLKETARTGWRIAYLLLREPEVTRLEQHPDSFESFEPISGESLLFVAPAGKPERVECFRLDTPVILDKGVWHGVLTLTPESEIKITENARVRCVYLPLKKALTPK